MEAFHIKNKKILGLMWHPERYSKIKKIDQKIIKTFYANNSFSKMVRVQGYQKISKSTKMFG